MSLAHYVFLTLLFLSQPVLHSAQNSSQPHNDSSVFFDCGRLGIIGYPLFKYEGPVFHGVIAMNCTASVPKAQFREKGKWYPVNDINYLLRRIEIHDEDLQSHLVSNRCDLLDNFSEEEYLKNFTEQKPPYFVSFNINETRPFFKCKQKPKFPSTFFNQYDRYNCSGYDLYYKNQEHLPPLPETLSDCCSVVHLPPAEIPDYDVHPVNDSLTAHWGANFTIDWKILQACVDCSYQGGKCESTKNRSFQCSKKGSSIFKKVIIGSIAGTGTVVLTVLFFLCWRMGTPFDNSFTFWKRKKKSQKVVEDFLKNHGSLVPKRYHYTEIKYITNSFNNKIGQGGYGGVYKGKLFDGRPVAVKLLHEAKGDGQEFINEVASISRTNHVNVVNLLGFCFEGSKRALIYEFMANGSLGKFIYNHDLSGAQSQLGWETLYQIAAGVGRGLEYLHRGCNTRILHFDIKPHNILLDEDFTPKISDFGLSKLCPRKESIISMLDTRGTVGYIAPELVSRIFGGVSHKSDVYSYGMMVLEMVGRRKNVDIGVDHTSEIYFPNWIYEHLELNQNLGLHGNMSDAEAEIARRMILVALWCIQTNPTDRPTMSRVLEMLEVKQEQLSIPPKPHLCSPQRSPSVSSTN